MNNDSGTPAWPFPVKKFVCHQCGNCCRGDGYVELTDSDIRRMADLFKMTREEFLDRYAAYQKGTRRWHLIDQSDPDKSCIFLTADNRCRVHAAKPEQCEGFPMRWRSENIADYCEGWRAMEGLPPSKKRTI